MNKAIVIHAADDLRIEACDRPDIGGEQVSIAVERGGICGSDLHYFNHGGFGAVRLREPMILGHEVAGLVQEVGSEVAGIEPGDRVAISPSRPCYNCEYCNQKLHNHCLNMRFYGSAMPMPHIQGAFRQLLVAEASQCHRIVSGVSTEQAAFAEPFAVGLHAVRRAGGVAGKRVLVSGAGPIGVLAAMACRLDGAGHVTITDLQDTVLVRAEQTGVDAAVNIASDPHYLDDWARNKGSFDVVIEASGSPRALVAALEVVRPRGTIIQLGLGGEANIPFTALVAREAQLVGSFRFHEEFGEAVSIINQQKIDFTPLLTGVFPLNQAIEAFRCAGDRAAHMKVQIDFTR